MLVLEADRIPPSSPAVRAVRAKEERASAIECSVVSQNGTVRRDVRDSAPSRTRPAADILCPPPGRPATPARHAWLPTLHDSGTKGAGGLPGRISPNPAGALISSSEGLRC